jgi:hypothetical protein
MSTRYSIHRHFLRAGIALLALTLAAPVVHAAPAGSRKPGVARKAKVRGGAQTSEKASNAAKLKLRKKELDAALTKAQGERDQALARVQPLLGSGHPERAANHLLESALMYSDPVLHLEAAEQFLAAADRRHPDALAKGRETAAAARTLLTSVGADPMKDLTVDVRAARVPHANLDGLLDRCAAVEHRLVLRGAELRRQRRGRQELVTGASLLAVGLTGAGVLASGLVYRGARERELAAIAGHEAEYDLSALDAQGRRADAMIGAGAVVGALGMVLGASLVALGARDLRGKPPARHAQLRVGPTLGGLVLSGRF